MHEMNPNKLMSINHFINLFISRIQTFSFHFHRSQKKKKIKSKIRVTKTSSPTLDSTMRDWCSLPESLINMIAKYFETQIDIL